MPASLNTSTYAALLAACAAAATASGQSAAPAGWSLHAQSTLIDQGYPPISAAYSGENSLDPNGMARHTLSATVFIGRALWPGASLYYDPEMTQGEGINDTVGIAGFPNGEGSRASSKTPQYDTARLYIQQVIDLGGASTPVEDGQNQIAGSERADRITLTLGKFSAPDIFDTNTYSHDARSQFLNWSLVDDGAWDYPADAKGYTGGFTAEWSFGPNTLRWGIFMEPREANGLPLDSHIDKAHGQALEWEHRYQAGGRSGAVRILGFWNQADMGVYQTALGQSAPPDITLSRAYRSKTGAGLNWEQEVADGVGLFARAGFDDGHTETWAFTEIDRSVSAGASIGGSRWRRPGDTVGVAGVVNGLSPEHRRYLEAGGIGFIVGDGRLNYGFEQIAETYYSCRLARWLWISADYQFIANPGYNRDRGPVNVFGLRLHAEY